MGNEQDQMALRTASVCWWWATDEIVESQYPMDRWTTWRWWDGEWWSIPAFSKDSASVAAYYAALPSGKRLSDIVWCDYWPKNARVLRVNPNEET